MTWALGLAWASALASGCLIDEDAPCNAGGFEVSVDGTCLCPAGSVPADGRCQPCGTHELAAGSACECEAGYARDTAGVCALRPVVATPDAGPTGGADRPCGSSSECGEDALCDVYDSGRCTAAPAGLGAACASQEDCAGTAATYCELFSSRTCQVQGCLEQAGVCPGDLVCCDFAILGTSLCIPADRIENGACPAPGQRVDRQEP